MIFKYNQLINQIKSSKILPLLRLRRRLTGAGTSGSGPSGFRINGRLWLEEDGETRRLDIARALVIGPSSSASMNPPPSFINNTMIILEK